MTSLLSGDVSSLKVGYSSFGSLVSDSTVSKPIFEIEATEEKKKVHSLKRVWDKEILYLKEYSSLYPLRQGRV